MKILKKIHELLTGKTLRDLTLLKESKAQQDSLFSHNQSLWKKDKKLVVFFTSDKALINGGILSIFSLAKYSRSYSKNVIIMSLGEKWTHFKNNLFKNDDYVYRFEQLFRICEHLEFLTLNIPECWVEKFNNLLEQEHIKALQKIKHLHINILNQNVELMPTVSEVQKLKQITNAVTQTTVHVAYATQEMANKYGIPTHFLLTYIDLSSYEAIPFNQKEKIIVLSPDKNSHKKEVVKLLKKNLPDYKLVTVRKLTFDQYIELISKAVAVITFGEGFDGYFQEPSKIGTIGFAVYNETFFPSAEWKNFSNVYDSWDSLKQNICSDIESYVNDLNLYYQVVNTHKECEYNITQKNVFLDNMGRFYAKQYDFCPQEKEPFRG